MDRQKTAEQIAWSVGVFVMFSAFLVSGLMLCLLPKIGWVCGPMVIVISLAFLYVTVWRYNPADHKIPVADGRAGIRLKSER
jgi:uncharacterized membrane protein